VTLPVPLREAGEEGRFGGKAASLSHALAAGLPVPPGIALSVDAVDSVVRGDEEPVRALEASLDDLGGCVAVRSSAIGEDDRDTSFAGQHATLLNVRTPAGVVAAVREVYQSAHSASALAYRERMGISLEPRMGVVVQRLVDAESAGVLFTRNPASGEDERLIEAAWGLGEAVVSGIIIPDSYRISRDGTVTERIAGHKDVALQLDPGGGVEEIEVEAERVDALCLSDDQLGMLHRMTSDCEAVYGDRLDIEWAFADGRFYLLQCRAITR